MSVNFASLGYIDRLEPPAAVPTPPPTPASAVNMFQEAEVFVHDLRKTFGSVAVTLSRDGVTFITVATPGSTPFSFIDKHMITQHIHSRDYLIDIGDYQFTGVLNRPKKGDKIIETQGSKTYTYQVLPFNDEPVYRFSGTYRTAYRVHTKLIKEEDV